MSLLQSDAFAEQMQRIEALIDQVERSSDPAGRDAARELLRTLLDLHRAALGRLLESLGQSAEAREVVEACAGEDLVGGLLLLHDLHPRDLPTRVAAAVEKLRPKVQSQGGDVELTEVREGIVRLKLTGGCGCASSSDGLKEAVEQAMLNAAPDAREIHVEAASHAAEPALVQLGLPHDRAVPHAEGKPS